MPKNLNVTFVPTSDQIESGEDITDSNIFLSCTKAMSTFQSIALKNHYKELDVEVMDDDWYHDVLDKHLRDDTVILWTTGDDCETSNEDTIEMKQLLND